MKIIREAVFWIHSWKSTIQRARLNDPFSTVWVVSAPYPCVVKGSTVDKILTMVP